DHVAREPERRREDHVDARRAEFLLAVDPLWLARQQARAADAIAPDVHQRAALEVGQQPDVLRIAEEEAEGGAHEPQASDRALGYELRQPLRLRVVAIHERLHQQPARTAGGGEGLLSLRGGPL